MLLATVAPSDSISDYNILVMEHFLGGALATLFTADIGEFGIDAGRALPQVEESEPWWKAITNTFMGQEGKKQKMTEPPRPKTLRMYNFGSPRVGNKVFTKRFDQLIEEGKINQAYRIVNKDDVVARMPRTMYTLSTDYDHVGSTVLVVEKWQRRKAAIIMLKTGRKLLTVTILRTQGKSFELARRVATGCV